MPEQPSQVPNDDFFGWIIGSLAVCRVCSAMVPDHTDAQVNHQRWHATLAIDPLSGLFTSKHNDGQADG